MVASSSRWFLRLGVGLSPLGVFLTIEAEALGESQRNVPLERVRGGVLNRPDKTRTPKPAETFLRQPGPLVLCGQPFRPDGAIHEFVTWRGSCQDYFITDWMDPELGDIKADTHLCADQISVDSWPAEGFSGAAGPTGFQDHPCVWSGTVLAPTGFNIGRLFVTFDPFQDPDLDPSNGQGVYFLAIDISAPRELDLISLTRPVAFDIDGDGDRSVSSESVEFTEVPMMGQDTYGIGIDMDSDGNMEILIVLGEQWGSVPDGAVSIDPHNHRQRIDGLMVRRFVKFRDTTGLLQGTPEALTQRFLDAHHNGIVDWRDFGIGDDIELAVLNVTGLPGNQNPYEVTFRAWADAADDGVEDEIVMRASFPSPFPSGLMADEDDE